MSDELRANLWAAYRQDCDKKWLETMLVLGLFEEDPMGKEIANAFKSFVPAKDTISRDDFICDLYGKLHPEFDGQYKKSAIRDLNFNFPEMNYEAIRKVLQRKFDPKKHLKNNPSVIVADLRK